MTLRILDGGCHDGFLGKFLQDKFGDNVELYGVELHSVAAQKARERGYKRVAECQFEHCYMHEGFDIGSFDVVVMYELIEHVSRPESLLRIANMMLKPGGRVLVSTPDGCFGAGNNPHHLRAYRAIDLATLLRKHGRLLDMGVGADGVTIAAYTPVRKRGEVAIYTGPSWEKWHPLDIANRGLGGSETAAYRLAEALSDLGYLPTIYGDFEDEGIVREVMLRRWQTFDPTVERLAVIASRMPEIFDRWVNAKQKLLWGHDVDFGERLTAQRADRIDHVLALSDWHSNHLVETYPFLAEGEWDGARSKIRKIRNGITTTYFTVEPAPERERRVLYTSSPDRGLDLLLEMWPQVRRLVPDAELVHTYAPVYDRVADVDPRVGKFREHVKELADQPGVRSISGLPQPKLAELMRSSMVWAHPSYNTLHDIPFHETSCIGAMEAQAAGLCVVASNWGALPETVWAGALIDGPMDDRWQARFAEEIALGLTSEQRQQAAQTEGPEYALRLSWAGVGDMVAAIVEPESAPVALAA